MRIATEVEPRIVPLESVKVTKARLLVGSKGTLPMALANMPKDGVLPGLIVVDTTAVAGERQIPVAGFVWQMLYATGSEVWLALAVAAIVSPASPTFMVATANAPALLAVEMSRMPGSALAAKAMISGTGAAEADSINVFKPVVMGAGLAFAQ